MPQRLTPLDFATAAVEGRAFTFTQRWQELFRLLFGDVATVSSLPAIINRWALADQPSLAASDAGYLAFVSDYGNHLVRWTGSVWEWADDGNGYRRDFAIAPPSNGGWALCDGSATTLLTVGGATLTTTAYTTPDLTGSPAFHKSIAAYTGTIEAAVAPAVSGSTADATATISGSTASESSHQHNNWQTTILVDEGTAKQVPEPSLTGAGSLHSHGKGTLAVDNHMHAVGTLAADTAARPPSIGWLPYVRR